MEDNKNLKEQMEKEAQLLIQQEEAGESSFTPIEEVKPITLGKAQKFTNYETEDDILAAEIGWKNVPMESLPSQGYFYASGTQVAIRAATVSEIRHWSTIDENDLLGLDDMLNFIIEKCCRIKVPGKPGTFKDLKEIDRFYLIFAIRDYTFKNGENKLFVTVSDDDGQEQKIEVTKDSLDYFNPDEKLMKYFKQENQCFDIQMKNGENFKIYLPSLGIMAFIKNYIKNKQQANQGFDKTFIKYAPFLFSDWKMLNQATYDKSVQESFTWSLQKISVMDKLVELLSSSINPAVRYQSSGGGEGRAPLNFQGGVKSLFLISDIFDELV
jgi:hypothetical protein